LDYLAFDEACGVPNSGSIEAITPSGGVGPYAVDLMRGDTQLTNFDSLSGGTYQLGFTDANGCRATVPVVLTTPTVPTVQIIATNDLIYLGDPVQLRLNQQAATTWAWNLPPGSDCPDCTNPSWVPDRTFTARVTATSEDGCVAGDSLRILVIPRYDVFVPTAFSPNGDGVNDHFYPNFGAAAVELISLSVYDRWGGLVYRTANQETAAVPLPGWDGGLSGGLPASPGVYLWTMEVRFRDGHTERRGGDVMLVP
jgi:gliding motility-associated-like protein